MKDDKLYLYNINDAILKIEKYTKNVSEEMFLEDSLIQDAVIRNIEIIGEMSNKISTDLKSRYSNIPWEYIIEMRNELICNYFKVDIVVVWKTIQKDIPMLKSEITRILATYK